MTGKLEAVTATPVMVDWARWIAEQAKNACWYSGLELRRDSLIELDGTLALELTAVRQRWATGLWVVFWRAGEGGLPGDDVRGGVVLSFEGEGDPILDDFPRGRSAAFVGLFDDFIWHRVAFYEELAGFLRHRLPGGAKRLRSLASYLRPDDFQSEGSPALVLYP